MRRKIHKSIASSTIVLAFAGLCIGSSHATDEGFDVSMNLQSAITITETNALSFVDTTVGRDQTIVTAPDDALAAKFNASGNASTVVTGSVVETSITMITGGGTAEEQIEVDNFATGGDMSDEGVATFTTAGNLNNLRIGGTANVLAGNIAGTYAGTATFRLIY